MKDIFPSHHIPLTFEKIPGTAPWKPLNDAVLFLNDAILFVIYGVLSHDLRLHSNRVLKVLAEKRQGTSYKTIPLRRTCIYYRTWKTIGDALIYPKHTAFTINIHHAQMDSKAHHV